MLNASVDMSYQTWQPAKWNQIVGNYRLKSQMMNLVRTVRTTFEATGQIPASAYRALLLTGASRGGKTSIVEFVCRCLGCSDLDREFNPCHRTCRPCRDLAERGGQEGLFAVVAARAKQPIVDLRIVDCTKLQTPSQLAEMLARVQPARDSLLVAVFDEVHRLVKRQMDEMLLKEVEQKQALWIFATAMPKDLEQMFLNRLIKLHVERPDEVEFAEWICDRCEDGGLKWTSEAVERLVARSNGVPGLALQCLAQASMNPDGLTATLVDDDWLISAE